ncbi:MAG TPA: YdcF family protein [Roseiflexaceae bacterium]|nr:YdcF family protein [Roseiflexaceae bacterium]
MAFLNHPRVRRRLREVARGAGLALLSLMALIAVLCALIVVQGQRDEAQPASAALVLGAAQWNGDPSPVLRARLDHALDLYRSGMVERIILTGGVGPGDALSEAEAGRDYLVAQGVPSDTLLLETSGQTTWQSLRNADALAGANGLASVLLVSDPFHMLRALKMAHDLGLNARGSPTRTSPISRNRLEETGYVLRESWAYLVYVFARQ